MGLSSYSDLQTAIANWMDRSDLAAVIPDFIALFETTANAELPLRTRFNLTQTLLSSLADARAVSLPANCLEPKTLTLTYYQNVPALSATNPTNWLLSNFPNLYLFGSLVAAESYLGADPRLKLWGDLYADLVEKLTVSNER